MNKEPLEKYIPDIWTRGGLTRKMPDDQSIKAHPSTNDSTTVVASTATGSTTNTTLVGMPQPDESSGTDPKDHEPAVGPKPAEATVADLCTEETVPTLASKTELAAIGPVEQEMLPASKPEPAAVDSVEQEVLPASKTEPPAVGPAEQEMLPVFKTEPAAFVPVEHAMLPASKIEPAAIAPVEQHMLPATALKADDIECWDDDDDLQLDDVPLAAKASTTDDFENDLELPDDGAPLKLSARKDVARPGLITLDDFEEWTEGSLGTRHGGTRLDARSPRSSSFTAMSPSLSSSFTVESEDEGLDGLVLPEGPLNLSNLLKKRQEDASIGSPEPTSHKPWAGAPLADQAAAKDDFFSGIDIGDGDVFDAAKSTLNRNLKHKVTRPGSPTRGTATPWTSTSKSQAMSSASRIPRLMGATDRLGSTLEPVSETGGPVPGMRRPQSRLSGPSAPSSASSIPLPSTPSRSNAPQTPSKQRELRNKTSMASLRPEPTTTSAQLLRFKRSMPVMRAGQGPPAKAFTIPPRPPTRQENDGRAGAASRPKTPIDRGGADSSLGFTKRYPFLPAGIAGAQSHHVATKVARNGRRHDSESSMNSADPPTRCASRAGAPSRVMHRSPSPRRKDVAPESSVRLASGSAAAARTVVQPAKRRFFGDGSELEVFDDLPTSTSVESKYVKAPIGRGAPRSMRSKLGLLPLTETTNTGPTAAATPPTTTTTATTSSPSITTATISIAPPSERMESPTPVPATPLSPPKPENVTPRFARDTFASRAAREQRAGTVSGLPMPGFAGNWKTQLAVRGAVGMGMAGTSTGVPRVKRRRAGAQQKPHLIKPLGDNHNSAKSVKGMHYNPELYRWEGNENALASFDSPVPMPMPPASASSPLGGAQPPLLPPARSMTPAGPAPTSSKLETPVPQRPALITNINTATASVQVVGGMVFDPQRMCWLKLSQHPSFSGGAGAGAGAGGGGAPHSPATSSNLQAFTDDGDDSDDPFAGLEDLEEGPVASRNRASRGHSATTGGGVELDSRSPSPIAEDAPTMTQQRASHNKTTTTITIPTSNSNGNGNSNTMAATTTTAATGAGAGASTSSRAGSASASGSASGKGLANDEWLVGEEFDVGPEFIRRQRDEEGRWTRKVGVWMGPGRGQDGGAWRYEIKRVISGSL